MGKAKVSSGKDLTTGPIGRGILAFAIPLFLGQLLQQLYNVADAWVVGNLRTTMRLLRLVQQEA